MYQGKTKLKRKRASLRLNMLAGFKEIPIVKIPEIPKKLELFPGTKADYWKLIPTEKSENKTSCLYKLGPRITFNTHIHLENDEEIELLTPGTLVEFITEEDIYFYEYPAVFKVPMGMKHALVSLVDFPIDFRVNWYPAMAGWNAEFKQLKNEKL